jgi:hypothetical protein
MKLLKVLLLLLAVFSLAKAQTQSAASTGTDKIIDAYLGIKNALAAGDATKASLNAKELFNLFSQQPEKGLSPEQQKILAAHLAMLTYDARHISESTAVDHQREHFASLSKNLYIVLKAIRKNTATLYEQYCPMTKTYWISETKKIINPYYGPSTMSTCGITKETLPAVN